MHRSVGSFALDSLSLAGSGAPPPGYTSQRDATSSIAMIDDDDDDQVLLKNSPPPPSMESPYTLPSPYSIEDLRSHHENHENPRLSGSRVSLHQSCTHGYACAHTHHSQCTPVRSTSYYPPPQQQQRAHTCDALHFYSPPQVLSTDNLIFGATTSEQSRPSSQYYRCSTDEHWQPPVQADSNQQNTSPYTDYILSSSSPHHHRRQNTHPPPLRVLTYNSTDEGDYGSKEYGNEEEGNQSSLHDQGMVMMMMNSTATILSPPEEPLGYQLSSHDLARRRRRSSLPNVPTRQATTSTTNDVVAMNSTKTAIKKSPTTNSSSAKAHSTQPTNYVHLSRKCNPSIPTSKSRGWRRKTTVQQQQQQQQYSNTQIPPPPPPRLSSSSAITGTFVINPELYIPPSLLNAMEDPVFFRFFKPSSSDTAEHGIRRETRKRKTSTRRTNLRLEVENGGIDVDIRLVPATVSSTNVGEREEEEATTTTTTCTGNRGQQQQQQQQQRDTFCDDIPSVQAQQASATSTSTIAFSGPPTGEARLQSFSIRMQENPVQPSHHHHHGTSSSSRSIPQVVTTHTTSSTRRDKKKPSRPTTIDLRIKQQAHQLGSLNIQNQDSVKMDGPIASPLIARIHAPNPRPPFHLFASTIDIPNPIQTTDSTSNQHTSPQMLNTSNQSRASTLNPTTTTTTSIRNSQVYSEPTSPIINQPLPRRRTRRSLSKHRPQRVSVASSSHGGGITPTAASYAPSPSLTPPSQLNLVAPSPSSSSSSPLYLHLPRTFRGPLTIHISSGHISDRLRISEGLEREIALIRESEFSRGYFVGGLGWDDNNNNNNNNNMDADSRKRVRDVGREEEEMGDGGNDVNNSGASGGGGIDNRDQIVDVEKTKKIQQLGNNSNKNIMKHGQLVVDDSELSSSSSVLSSSSPYHSSLSSSSSSSSSSPSPLSPAWKGGGGGGGGEWYGDRIEILVGSGDVYLQFEDENEEDDPFFRNRSLKKEVGFWKRFFLPRFLFL